MMQQLGTHWKTSKRFHRRPSLLSYSKAFEKPGLGQKGVPQCFPKSLWDSGQGLLLAEVIVKNSEPGSLIWHGRDKHDRGTIPSLPIPSQTHLENQKATSAQPTSLPSPHLIHNWGSKWVRWRQWFCRLTSSRAASVAIRICSSSSGSALNRALQRLAVLIGHAPVKEAIRRLASSSPRSARN